MGAFVIAGAAEALAPVAGVVPPNRVVFGATFRNFFSAVIADACVGTVSVTDRLGNCVITEILCADIAEGVIVIVCVIAQLPHIDAAGFRIADVVVIVIGAQFCHPPAAGFCIADMVAIRIGAQLLHIIVAIVAAVVAVIVNAHRPLANIAVTVGIGIRTIVTYR